MTKIYIIDNKEYATVEEVDNVLKEGLANLCHKQWSHWMEYLFSKCHTDVNNNKIIPSEFVDRWTRQMDTDYDDLSQDEQDSDRKEAEKFMELIK